MMRFEQGTRWYGGDNQDALSTTQSVAKRRTNTYYSIEPKVDMRNAMYSPFAFFVYSSRTPALSAAFVL